jgi:hypothetical protein
VQDAEIPVRAAPSMNERGDIVFQRPQVSGTQTAIVVGLGEPVHTDRDGRIKLQFHWQRGASSALRLDHAAGSNAPGDDSTGTWVRVMQPWTGANWGAHFTPRLGQEVLVSFVEGDVDRPVVIGSAYNGQGSTDAQGNQVSAGAGSATGNAGAWFPGGARSGNWQGHQHPQVLAGFKSQSLDASQSGGGGYNQLALDDSPGESRTVLGSTTAATWLQLGHLLQQDDNQRLAARGHGLDLATTAHGAVRGGSGLLLSTFTRAQGTQSAAQSIETRATLDQLEESRELARTLADTAQKQQAKLEGESSPAELPGLASFVHSADSVTAILQTEASEVLAAGGNAPEESEQQSSVFDEQIRFLDQGGVPLTGVKYSLTLADGRSVDGVTDDAGYTSRVVTPVPTEFTSARITGTRVACCAADAGDDVTELQLHGLATNRTPGSTVDYKVDGETRSLTAGEIRIATLVFGDSIDYARVKVHRGAYLPLSGNSAMTPNGEMYFPKTVFQNDFTAQRSGTLQIWFIHEMVHVWQFQLGYSMRWNGFKLLIRGGYSADESGELPAYRYRLDEASTKKLSDYNMEQQGDLIAHYFAATHLGMHEYQARLPFLSAVLKDFLRNPKDAALLPTTTQLGP